MPKIKPNLSKKSKKSTQWEILPGLDIPAGGQDVQIRLPNGQIKTVNTASPLYAQMYDANQIQSAAGTEKDPIMLNEVTVTPPKGFIGQYTDRYMEENKDSGPLEAILSPFTYALGLPQQAMMYGLTGKSQLPSEALGIENPLGAFAVNAIADPTNFAGVGLLDDIGKLRNLGKFNPFKIKPNITSSVNNFGNGLDLEELRRVYHNSERFLMPEESRFLHKHGHGLRENYVTNPVSNQLPPPPSEIQIMPDGTTRNIYTQQPQPVIPIMLGGIDIRRSINGFAPGTPEWNRLNDIIQNTAQIKPKPKNIINKSGLTKEEAIAKASQKDKDIISKMSEEEFRETVLKPTGEVVPYDQKDLMSEFTGKNNVFALSPQEYTDEFNSRLDLLNDIIANNNKSGVEYRVKELTSDGRLTFYTPEQTIPNANNSVPQHYLDALNRIDEPDFLYKGYEDKFYFSNMSGSPGFSSREEAKKWITDIIEKEKGTKIKSGESTWGVRLNPGQWEGNVEDIANTEYLRSIPGLEMSNTTSGVFADHVARRGTGAYESINEYLKKLNLGRVKPGFNSQTDYSRGAWENFIKSGRGVGFYANPRTVYGTMKSVFPYVAPTGLGLGAIKYYNKDSEKPVYKKGGKVKTTPYGQWEYPGEITRIPGNTMRTDGYGDIPLYVVPNNDLPRIVYANTGNHYFPNSTHFTEYPIKAQDGGNIPTAQTGINLLTSSGRSGFTLPTKPPKLTKDDLRFSRMERLSINDNRELFNKVSSNPRYKHRILDGDYFQYFKVDEKPLTRMEPRKADFQTSPSLFSKRLSEPIFKKPAPKRAIAYKHDTDIPIEYEKRNGGTMNNQWEIIGETNNFQKGGKVVSEVWQDVTGTPWSQAKKLGLTSGGYDENIKLRTELLKNPEKFAKEFGTKETPAPVRRPQQAPQPAGKMYGPFINQDTSGIKLPYPVSYNWSSAPNLSPTTNVVANDPYSTNVTASGRNIPKQPGFFENIVKGITDSELVKDVSDVIKSVRDIEDVKSSFERGLGKLGVTRPGTEDVEPMIVETPPMQNVPPVKIDSSLAANNTATVDTTPTTYRQFSGIKDPKSGTQYGRYVNTFSNWKGQEYIPTKNVGQWKKDKTTKYPSNQMAHFLLDTDVSQGYINDAAKKQINAQKQGRSITAGSSLKEQWLPVYEDLGNGKIRVKYKTNKQLTENDKVLAPFRQYKYEDLDWEGQKKKSTWNKSSYAIKTKSGEETRIISSGKDDTGYGRFGGGSFVIIGKRKNGEEVIREMSGSVRDLKDQAKDLAKSLGQNVNDLVIGFHDVGSWSAKPSSSSKTLGFENLPKKNAEEFETYQKDYTGAGLAFPLQKMGGKIKNSNFKEEEVMLPNLMEMAFGGMYQTGGKYNMNRAVKLGYTPDETGHWKSVDSETGMWLKSKEHPTAWMEYMQYSLNPELNNKYRVIANPEGYFGENQLQYIPNKAFGGLPKAQVGLFNQQVSSQDSVKNIAKNIIDYEVLRGGPGGHPLDGTDGYPDYRNPKYMDMLMKGVYPEVKKIMPNATAMEIGEAMDFIFNSGFDKTNKKILKDPRGYAIQEYYRKYDKSKLDDQGNWVGRKNEPYSFDQEYANTIGKLSENERRILMNKGRDWYYQNIDQPSPGIPSSDYKDTWYGRIWNTNKYAPFNPNNPNFTPKQAFGGNIMLEKYDKGGKKNKKKRQKAEPPYPIDSPLDMYGRPMLANPRIIPGLDRSFYDPRLNKINFGSDFTDADTYSKDKMMAHENYHAYQHANDMDTYLPVRDIPYAKPPMVSTDEYYSSYYNRKPIEVETDIANFRQKNPSFNFVPDRLIYDAVVDYDQYLNPFTLEGSAKIYEDLGDEVPFEPIYKEGGKTPIWQRKEGKSPSGGLNAKGRASLKREGHDIKPPQPQGGPRKRSFCSRMKGMKKKLTSAKTANDPNSRINLSLRKWKC
jgi:hypothetical protein